MLNKISKLPRNIANSKIVKEHITKSITDPKFLTSILIVTSVSKDVYAHALRVEADLKNDKVPKGKKRYMTILDATMGVVTAAVQIGTAAIVGSNKVQNKVCSKLFSSLGKNTEAFKNASKAFGVLSTLTLSTILAKRLIVPTIATPIAGALCGHKGEEKTQTKQKPLNHLS